MQGISLTSNVIVPPKNDYPLVSSRPLPKMRPLPNVLSQQSNPAALNDALRTYFALPRAQESAPGMFGIPYTSTRIEKANLLMNIKSEDWMVASLPTSPEVAEMRRAGVANMFVPEWQQVVAGMAQRNGGLGSSEDGFLAFSQEYGFVRLRNPRMTPEQNRRIAEISLQTGTPVEVLPSRIADSALEDGNVNRWVDEVIGKFEVALQKFIQNPEEGFSVKDGRRRFEMKIDPQTGLVQSTYHKKSGGLKGFIQQYAPKIIDVIDGISGAKWLKEIPVVGGVLSSVVDTFSPGFDQLKTVIQSIAHGKFDWKGILSKELSRLATMAGTWASAGGGIVAQLATKAAEIGSRVLGGGEFQWGDLVDVGKVLFGKGTSPLPESPEIDLPNPTKVLGAPGEVFESPLFKGGNTPGINPNGLVA